ncbi:MAG: serine/threonine-protein kinase [Mariprofundaceae bacterium]
MIDKKHSPHLGQYRLDNKLGEGGMGIVYQATDEKLHREIAIKVLHPHLLQNENLKERFRREARMHAKLMHPNVVTLLSLYEDGEHMALVMEMVHGKNLKEYLKVNPSLSLVDLVKICDAILAGLDAAHHLGMVHRDLKPANVLLSTDGAIKLMDFGLAKPQRGEDDLTQSGATVGSFRYMAPEQILNQPVDARTDLYAFGILLYQICTGKLPFDATAGGGGEFEIMEKQVREEAVAPHELVPTLPLDLSDLILRLLAKNPADRPLDCKEVRDDLHSLLRQESKDSKGEAIRMPTRLANEDSNADIARGLLRALAQNIFGVIRQASGSVKPGITTVQEKVEKTATSLPVSKRWQAPLTWGALALFMVGIGWILISVINLAERPTAASSIDPTLEATQETPSKVDKPAVKPAAKPVVKKPVVKPAVKPVVKKPVATVAKTPVKATVKTVKKTATNKPATTKKVSRSVTYYVEHKVVHSDNSKVDPKKPHEFRGGSKVWFSSLKEYKWKDKLHSFKKGQTRLYLKKPVSLSRIVLRKASVGRLPFREAGYITLSVQNSKGQWTQLFERKGDDVDIPVSFTGPRNALKDVKSVRLRFRTPEPIRIGPIDLIR